MSGIDISPLSKAELGLPPRRNPPIRPCTILCGESSSTPLGLGGSKSDPVWLNGVSGPPKPADPAGGIAGKFGFAERAGDGGVIAVDHHPAGAIHAIALGHLEGVGRAVGHLRGGEGGRQVAGARVGGIAVVPVRQGPIRRAAQLRDGIAHDGFEGGEIAAMPGQEIPALMLALERQGIAGRRERAGTAEIAEGAPQAFIEAMQGGEIGPARAIGDRPLLQRADAACVPGERVAPTCPELPDVLACVCHDRYLR